MRALVISDTHFGAWTGEDILTEPENLALLAPHLDVDEVIFLGDMFDFLFAPRQEAFAAADPLFDLLRDRLQGRRFVFLAGNHDHHFVTRADELALEEELARAGSDRQEYPPGGFFRRYLERRLDGVEVDLRYPTYTFAGVLCTHGHYLDVHARRSGSTPDRLLSRAIWSIAIGEARDAPTREEYEATITLLTELLYTIAQLPNGTRAQQRAFAAFRRFERGVRAGGAPVHLVERAEAWLRRRVVSLEGHERGGSAPLSPHEWSMARSRESERRNRTGAPTGGEASSYAFARQVRPSDPAEHAVEAFERVVDNLGWGRETDTIVFAHTHQPLDGVLGPSGRIRYWNTGSWLYEPDLGSPAAYAAYLRTAWPGTAVLIDSAADAPQLVRLREHLNPLHRADPSTRSRGDL